MERWDERLLTSVDEHDENSLVVLGRQPSRREVNKESDGSLREIQKLRLSGSEAKSIFDDYVTEGR